MKVDKYLKKMDAVLKHLSKNPTVYTHSHQIISAIQPMSTEDDLETDVRNYYGRNKEFSNILDFLQREKLIDCDESGKKYRILYPGTLKYAKGGFVQEWKDARNNNCLKRIFWIATPIAAAIGALFAFLEWFK